MKDKSLLFAARTMLEFAERTGLSPESDEPTRYLWTDAFAVCNFVGLHRLTGEEKFKKLAVALVDQVHRTLGRHRKDDSRSGWISGLSEEEGRQNPTAGGLRIGKELNERSRSEPYNERLEWNRDGQYFHYLTKWMHALDRAAWGLNEPRYLRWAIQLAKKAHDTFTYLPSASTKKRIYWKMSIDLSRPLVPSMGQHDPVDGYTTYLLLRASARKQGEQPGKNASELNSDREIAEMEKICRFMQYQTDDPLGIGGLLCDAHVLGVLTIADQNPDSSIFKSVITACPPSLANYRQAGHLNLPARYRLAFRELGLSIGLKASERLKNLIENHPERFDSRGTLVANVKQLERFFSLAEIIEQFWLDDSNRSGGTWTGHENINSVMLATSLVPDGFLDIEH